MSVDLDNVQVSKRCNNQVRIVWDNPVMGQMHAQLIIIFVVPYHESNGVQEAWQQLQEDYNRGFLASPELHVTYVVVRDQEPIQCYDVHGGNDVAEYPCIGYGL